MTSDEVARLVVEESSGRTTTPRLADIARVEVSQ